MSLCGSRRTSSYLEFCFLLHSRLSPLPPPRLSPNPSVWLCSIPGFWLGTRVLCAPFPPFSSPLISPHSNRDVSVLVTSGLLSPLPPFVFFHCLIGGWVSLPFDFAPLLPNFWLLKCSPPLVSRHILPLFPPTICCRTPRVQQVPFPPPLHGSQPDCCPFRWLRGGPSFKPLFFVGEGGFF